jgi:hypothetical protein
MDIRVGDIVYHQLSKLLFKCQNKQQERWMNMNHFYEKTNLKEIDYFAFEIQYKIKEAHGSIKGKPTFWSY